MEPFKFTIELAESIVAGKHEGQAIFILFIPFTIILDLVCLPFILLASKKSDGSK